MTNLETQFEAERRKSGQRNLLASARALQYSLISSRHTWVACEPEELFLIRGFK